MFFIGCWILASFAAAGQSYGQFTNSSSKSIASGMPRYFFLFRFIFVELTKLSEVLRPL